jgi:hypothetical protein
MLTPLSATAPSNGFCIPAIVRIKVDLPAPFGPSRQTSSPARNVAFRFSATTLVSLRVGL